MSGPRLTVLFVHGAWHTPAHFTSARSVLENAGYATSCPHMLTARDILLLVDISEDAQCIRDELRKLVEEEEREVIVIADSYGGIVTTQAMDQEFSKKDRGKDEGFVIMHNPKPRFYSDLPAADQKKWVNELVKFPAGAKFTRRTNLVYLYHRTTYLYCEDDQVILLERQKKMVQKRKDEGVEVNEEWCAASHSPFLSMPERILEVVESKR